MDWKTKWLNRALSPDWLNSLYWIFKLNWLASHLRAGLSQLIFGMSKNNCLARWKYHRAEPSQAELRSSRAGSGVLRLLSNPSRASNRGVVLGLSSHITVVILLVTMPWLMLDMVLTSVAWQWAGGEFCLKAKLLDASRVGVELHLSLQVLHQVGYNPESVSRLETLEGWCSVICVGEEIASAASSWSSWCRTSSWSVMQNHELMTKVVPSSNLMSTEAHRRAIEFTNRFLAIVPMNDAICWCFLPTGSQGGYFDREVARLSSRESRTRRWKENFR